jgi:hypothetical protein
MRGQIMSLTEQWQEIKVLVESLDPDVNKHAKGNASAGVRARRGLRLLKTKIGDYVKLTINEDKARRNEQGED